MSRTPTPAKPTVDDATIAGAAAMRRDELARLLQTFAPMVHRLAYGLGGEAARAESVVRIVLSRSLHAVGRFRSPDHARGWFLHHTVLIARQVGQRPPRDNDITTVDTLAAVDASKAAAPELLAFVRALRNLPFQQSEAVILTHGEGLDPRSLAVAMDCSTVAAANHLAAAETTLRAMTGDRFAVLLEQVRIHYLAADRSDPIVVEGALTLASRRRWIHRALGLLAWAAFVALLWLLWQHRHMVVT